MNVKKKLILTAVALVAAVLFSVPAAAAPETAASSAILIDGDTGAVLYSQNADASALIASTTKIMTAVVVLENCELQHLVEIPAEATGIEGSSIYLQPGECLTVEALLYGMMLHSGNDAAVALAIACSGSVEAFVARMNEKAQEWGLHDTSFANPNGLDSEENHSTAADLARMAMYALRDARFLEIVSTKNIVIGGRHLSNHNKLLWSMDGAIGVKTGYTKAAGRILVSAAEQKGRRLIAVTINDGNDWHDHKSLYAYGFAQYTVTEAVSKGDVVAQIPCLDGGTLPLLAGEGLSWAMAQGEEARLKISFPKLSYGEEKTGSTAGWAEVCLGERCIATIPVCWGRGETFYERTNTKDHSLPGGSLPACSGAAVG